MAKITIPALRLDNWTYSETQPKLRARLSKEFLALDNSQDQIVMGGQEFFLEWQLETGETTDGERTLTYVDIPEAEIFSTRDGVGDNSAYWIFEFVDANNNVLGPMRGFSRVEIPADYLSGTIIPWDVLYTFNHPQARVLTDRTTLSREQILSLNPGGVASFNGRQGAIVPVAGDYGADDLLSGNLAIARLGGGTNAGVATFWRGDGVWESPTSVIDISKAPYSATCDGSTDDSVAVAAAVAAAAAIGGAIYVPPSANGCKIGGITINVPIVSDGGTFYLDSLVTITKSIQAPRVQIFRNATGNLSLAGNYFWRETFPEWLGAIPDAVTDNSVPLADSIALGKPVTLSVGSYLYSTGLVYQPDTTFSGASWASILRFTGSGPATQIVTTVGNNTNLALKNFQIRATGVSSTHGIKLTDVYNVLIDGVEVSGANRIGFIVAGIESINTSSSNSGNLKIQNCWVNTCLGDGILFSDSLTGFSTSQAGTSIIGTHIQTNGGYGVSAPALGTRAMQSFSLLSNTIEGNLLGQVYIDNVQGLTIKSNYFEGSATNNPVVALGAAGVVKGADISSNSFSGGSSTYLIDFNGSGASSGIGIKNNYFEVATAAIRFTNVNGAEVINNTPVAISLMASLGANSTNIKVENEYGVSISSGSSGVKPSFGIYAQQSSGTSITPGADTGSMLSFGFTKSAGQVGTAGSSRRAGFGDILLAKNLSGENGTDNYLTVDTTTGGTGYAGITFQYQGVVKIFGANTDTTAGASITPFVMATFHPASGFSAPSIRGTAVAVAGLPAAPVEGMVVAVTNSNTDTWGATISGTGAFHVLAYYNGTNWTVIGK